MVATIKDPMDDNMEEGSNGGDESSEDERMDEEGFETVNRSGKVQEPDFNDPEGFVDDVDDEVLMADLIRQKPKESDGMDSVIVVDNIPSGIAAERVDKLKGVIRKIYGKVRFKKFKISYEFTKMITFMPNIFIIHDLLFVSRLPRL